MGVCSEDHGSRVYILGGKRGGTQEHCSQKIFGLAEICLHMFFKGENADLQTHSLQEKCNIFTAFRLFKILSILDMVQKTAVLDGENIG